MIELEKEEIKEEIYDEVYFNVLCKAIVHTKSEFYQNLYLDVLSDNNVLYFFSQYIDQMLENNFASSEVKLNIVNLCSKLRDIQDENRSERINIINNIILSINIQKEDKSVYFYLEEYAYRFNIVGRKVNDIEMNQVKQEIIDSIILDAAVLNTQSKEYTDQEFNIYIDIFADNPRYLLSLNYLLTMYSDVTVNEIFLNRTIKVLNRMIENAETRKQARMQKSVLKNVQKIKKKAKID